MTKIERAYKAVGEETLAEINSADVVTLKKRIVDANESMRQVAQELEDNDKYQELKENKKAMEAGMREVNKRQNAIILLALTTLERRGSE